MAGEPIPTVAASHGSAGADQDQARVRAASAGPAAAPLIRQLVNREMVVPLTVVLWVTHPDLGAALFAAPVTALVLVCGLVRVELLASAPI
jgi:hypothetical protein